MIPIPNTDYDALLNMYWEELVNEADYRAADEVLTKDFQFYGPGVPDGAGRKGFYNFIDELHEAFSDKHFEELERISMGDATTSRFKMTGIHDGVFRGATPTLKYTYIEGCDIFYFRGGKIAIVRAYFDMLEMMRQLQVLK